jgi:hypothetical protein
MPRLPDNPGRDSSAMPGNHGIDAEIAKLLATPPPTVDEFIADPIVRMRIGMLIARAVARPKRPRGQGKSR